MNMPLQEHELVVNLESNESNALISVYIKTYWAKHDVKPSCQAIIEIWTLFTVEQVPDKKSLFVVILHLYSKHPEYRAE